MRERLPLSAMTRPWLYDRVDVSLKKMTAEKKLVAAKDHGPRIRVKPLVGEVAVVRYKAVKQPA